MPLYEYECPSCEKVHEVMQKFSDPLLETCPDCKGPVSKLISMSSFALKGSGWYTTDYKRAGSAAKKAEAPVACSTGTLGSASTEAKAGCAKPECKT